MKISNRRADDEPAGGRCAAKSLCAHTGTTTTHYWHNVAHGACLYVSCSLHLLPYKFNRLIF